MQKIKKISALDSYTVRQPVLRPGKPVESCHFDGDEAQTTIHFGCYENNALIGVASLFEAENPAIATKKQFQLRGMAVLPDHQKKGIGEKLMLAIEKDGLQKGGHCIWFNAREMAVGFYRKLGYDISGAPFDIAGIGIHYVMFKILN